MTIQIVLFVILLCVWQWPQWVRIADKKHYWCQQASRVYSLYVTLLLWYHFLCRQVMINNALLTADEDGVLFRSRTGSFDLTTFIGMGWCHIPGSLDVKFILVNYCSIFWFLSSSSAGPVVVVELLLRIATWMKTLIPKISLVMMEAIASINCSPMPS